MGILYTSEERKARAIELQHEARRIYGVSRKLIQAGYLKVAAQMQEEAAELYEKAVTVTCGLVNRP